MNDTGSAPSDVPRDSSPRVSRKLSIRTKVFYSLLAVVALTLGAELTCRVGSWVAYGFSPYYLFYGWETWMVDHDPDGFVGAGYFKFHPDRIVKEYGLFQNPTPIRINNWGFRGEDFDADKAENTFRVVCLGGSSTFGFFDRDDFTYPALLQQRFERDSAVRVEVINSGIPQANSDNLLAMFREELLRYDPGLITVYAGYNDAVYYLDANAVQRMARWLHGHSATYGAIKNVLEAVGGPELHSKWRSFDVITSHEDAQTQIRLHKDRFQSNITEIISLAHEAGIQVMLILQPVDLIDGQKKSHGTHGTGAPYWDEVSTVRDKYDQGQPLANSEVTLLVHSELMNAVCTLAVEKQLSLVDNIAIVDAHPEYFASHVHLTEDANAQLADALHEKMTPIVRQASGSRSTEVARHESGLIVPTQQAMSVPPAPLAEGQ